MKDFEKLGALYLGRQHDLATGQGSDQPLLYDSRDLVTHAVIVGMTGSGKTGLGIALLEEAAMDGIPALIVDPKGDLGNLLLTFPDLAPEDFRPWINEDDARRKGLSPDQFAEQQAKTWRDGLASWGEDGERIRRLRDTAEIAIYTPGSSAGTPISILASFAAPAAEVIADGDLFRARVATAAASLLGLLGIDADPVRSREHILLSQIFVEAWSAGRDLDLAQLITQIQNPPMSRVGVMDLDSFFPAKDRFVLASQLNNLLASPSFQSWMEGEPLDIQKLLFGERGKPRLAVLSIAHLGDAERMFFVSLLLNQVLGWMRTQSGTTSLRALLYMDEVFGYLPPTANPSSKLPMLTLLKQGRAFGLGVVLATQNPVDLDYKALSNAGTWFLGRLQTERDKARVLEGLEGAAAGAGKFDRAAMEETLAGLKTRVFVMHNVHDDSPVVFETRWVMSYLRGPLTAAQIRTLTPAKAATGAKPPRTSARAATAASATTKPVLPPGVPQLFEPTDAQTPAYSPHLLGEARVHFADAKLGIETTRNWSVFLPIATGDVAIDWSAGEPRDDLHGELATEPVAGASFEAIPRLAADPKSYATWSKTFVDSVARTARLELLAIGTGKNRTTSRPGEGEADFRARLNLSGREERDRQVEALRAKFQTKVRTLEDRLTRARMQVEKQQSEAGQRKLETAVSLGATVLGALFGRRRGGTLGRASTTARSVGRVMKEGGDVDRARESVAALEEQLAALQAEIEARVVEVAAATDARTAELETLSVKPKKSDVELIRVALAWLVDRG